MTGKKDLHVMIPADTYDIFVQAVGPRAITKALTEYMNLYVEDHVGDDINLYVKRTELRNKIMRLNVELAKVEQTIRDKS